MTLIQKLDRTLSELNTTFYPGYYQGNGEDYGIYEGIVESPEMSADNETQITICECNVHLFAKSKQSQKKRKLLKLLKNADFTVGDVYEQYEAETNYTHYIAEVSALSEDYETEE